MTHQTKSLETGPMDEELFGGSAPASATDKNATYYELFREFNSERAFFDFAWQLKADSSYRPGAMRQSA